MVDRSASNAGEQKWADQAETIGQRGLCILALEEQTEEYASTIEENEKQRGRQTLQEEKERASSSMKRSSSMQARGNVGGERERVPCRRRRKSASNLICALRLSYRERRRHDLSYAATWSCAWGNFEILHAQLCHSRLHSERFANGTAGTTSPPTLCLCNGCHDLLFLHARTAFHMRLPT